MISRKPLKTIDLGELNKLIQKLEKGVSVPGTSITRSLCDVVILVKEGISVPKPHIGRSLLAWCVGVGPLAMPKKFYYGLTIEETLDRAIKGLRKHALTIEEVLVEVRESDRIMRTSK